MKSKVLSFHSFPKDQKRREKWIKLLRRQDVINFDIAQICSEHFEQHYIKRAYGTHGKVLLSEDSIPTIFAHSVQKTPTSARSTVQVVLNFARR